MILSHRHRYLFIHVPKTGGTAVTRALEGHLGPEDVVIGDTPGGKAHREWAEARRLWKHSRWEELGDLQQAAQGYLVFSIVRNPFDAVVSFYTWAQRQRFSHPMVEAAQKLTFSAFLRHPYVQGALRNMPYGRYVAGAEAPEFLRFETLEADFRDLCGRLGLGEVALPRVNVSERERDYREYYLERDVELLAQLCAEDIARFGYRF